MRTLFILLTILSLQLQAQEVSNTYKYTDSLPAYPEERELEFKIKFYLAEKYTPGSCYGMPSPRKVELDRVANYDIAVTSYIKSKVNLPADNDANRRMIETKIKQFHKIKLIKIAEGYQFEFIDGNCCRITSVKGVVTLKGGIIIDSITEKQVKHVPC